MFPRMESATSLAGPSTLNCMRKEVEIVNKLGLHARPAALFVRNVIRFKSTSTICKGEANFSAARHELETLLLRFRGEEGGAQGN